jgi:ubiquinone/menaquinone biosynthesis C-methylase UbiE
VNAAQISPSKAAARATYDRLSPWYDWLASSEQKFVRLGLGMLEAQPGEAILEIGPGTGHALLALGQAAGPRGRVLGADLSPAMLARAQRRVAQAGLVPRVGLVCTDGARLPVASSQFDAVFLSFTLELFDGAGVSPVLGECWRVLRPEGRLCAACLSEEGGVRWMLGLYEWAHCRFPAWVDCRPISPEQVLAGNGFRIQKSSGGTMWGLPVKVVLAGKA